MPVRIGELLLKEKRISAEQLQEALNYQKTNGGKLGANLVKLGYVKDEEITALLSKQYGVPSIALNQFEIDPAVIKLVPAETAVLDSIDKYYLGGLGVSERKPGSGGPVIQPQEAPGESALDVAAKQLSELPTMLADSASDVEVLEEMEEISAEMLTRQGEEAPVVKLVNVVLMSAISKGASDIHIEPYEKEYRVRYRIDGILYNIMAPPLKMRDAITSRVKIMSKLDIAEKRLPQDGRIKIRFSDNGQTKDIDFRVSCLPTLFGEKIVLRLLDKGKLMLDMTKLGFERESLQKLETQIMKPWGMVLVTGPTGSGKTNTLYSSIAKLNTAETNIMTAEDPVEFNLLGVNQVQVRENIGLNFAAALRSFLRQDPNIILVGEIRDFETAEIAVKAALTGHLVLSTLHTNDAPSTINRLMNMGIEPFLVASSLNLVCAQRLVRRICTNCKVDDDVPGPALEQIGFQPDLAAKVKPKKGSGCEKCNKTGYKGRVGLYEVMEITDELRELILVGASALELRRKAIEEGMITLRGSGLRKISEGVTTIEEVLRETVK